MTEHKNLSKDDAPCHIFPDDLEECFNTETYKNVYSVPMVSPDKGHTVPLYSQEQVNDRIVKAHMAGQEEVERLRMTVREKNGALQIAWRKIDELKETISVMQATIEHYKTTDAQKSWRP